MPLGDPMGGNYYDLGRGRLDRVWIGTVPVKDLDEAVEFYSSKLGLAVVSDRRGDNWVEMGPAGELGRIALYRPDEDDPRQPGIDTGIVFATDSIYEVHRRLVDEGVQFIVKPEKRPWGGLMAVFVDLYGNRFWVLDDPGHSRTAGPVAEKPEQDRPSNVTIRVIGKD